MSPSPHLLVVDDDARLRAVLRRYLQQNGFEVTVAANTAEARQHLASFAFDLIVLDVMMPGESGLDLLSDLRVSNPVPVLMLTAMADPHDRIDGLERGADEYLAKPFEPRELVLRLRNVLARGSTATPQPSQVLQLGACALDLERAELTRGQQPIHLTAGEAALLMALARHPGKTLSRETLSTYAQFAGGERAIDVQVTRLRRKIEPNPRFPRYLQTVRGTGYVLRPD